MFNFSIGGNSRYDAALDMYVTEPAPAQAKPQAAAPRTAKNERTRKEAAPRPRASQPRESQQDRYERHRAHSMSGTAKTYGPRPADHPRHLEYYSGRSLQILDNVGDVLKHVHDKLQGAQVVQIYNTRSVYVDEPMQRSIHEVDDSDPEWEDLTPWSEESEAASPVSSPVQQPQDAARKGRNSAKRASR
jgi:hypothetical protein